LAGARELRPALLLVPLLAFDRRGRRLGQGAGIYDRILAALRPQGPVAIGLAHAVQEMDAVPAGPLDATLDWVVTEKEAIRCGHRQSAVGNPQS
jgi:5-formyltetrahydrofolate cyclo-ligase